MQNNDCTSYYQQCFNRRISCYFMQCLFMTTCTKRKHEVRLTLWSGFLLQQWFTIIGVRKLWRHDSMSICWILPPIPFPGFLPILQWKQYYNQFSEWLTQELTSNHWIILNNSLLSFANIRNVRLIALCSRISCLSGQALGERGVLGLLKTSSKVVLREQEQGNLSACPLP